MNDLDDIAQVYARLSHDVGGRANFACDLDNEDALQAVEKERALLDHAFFILSFGALEQQITSLACVIIAAADRRNAMRDQGFDRRLVESIVVARRTLNADVQWANARTDILSWYKIRSDIAHGRRLTGRVDPTSVIAVIRRAQEIAKTLDEVSKALEHAN